jgi:hypothetical protein
MGCAMNALQRIHQWQRQAHMRELLIITAIGLPIMLGLYFLLSRYISQQATWLIISANLLLLVWVTFSVLKKFNQAWLIRQLDAHLANLENSADLLFAKKSELSVLQNLQQQRVEQRILTIQALDLRQAWPYKRIAVAYGVGVLMIATALYWPYQTRKAEHDTSKSINENVLSASTLQLLKASIVVSSPTYTGIPVRIENSLNAKFSEGSVLRWKLTFKPQPQRVSIVFFDGSQLPLQRVGDVWQASRRFQQSQLYRIDVDGIRLAQGKRYRLDAIKDQAPQLRVIQPERNLSLMKYGQSNWPLSMEASDDYGLGNTQLRIQLAQGSGENINFSERNVALTGQGNALRKRYVYSLDLAALGLAAGDDVIVQFSVSDRQAPQANTVRSASFILRWPPEDTTQASGVEGILKKLVPAYFRSQRQIIIDTEKLLLEQKKLSKETFEVRSDTIGVDQRILRLRYGQFLGEESEGGRASGKVDSANTEDPQAHADEHEHKQNEPSKKVSATEASSTQFMLEQFGHTHDIAEAATLLDAKTKELLRAALNEMWQAELNLRQAQPKKALPYEYRALGFIKQVQQASRIYLARMGSELPPIDETRRMSGNRTGLQTRNDWLIKASNDDAVLLTFWQALDNTTPLKADFFAMQTWINSHSARIADPLSVLAALDDVQSQPNCASCVLALKAQLWPLLAKPAAEPLLRKTPSKTGQAYLDALRKDEQP